jgi:hypothetical protein
MGTVEVDLGNPNLYKPMEFKTLPKGKHTFEVANDLVVEPAASSGNNVIKVELVCQDEGEEKGSRCWDNFTLVTDASTEKGRKAKEINQARLVQFALACGVRTKEQIAAAEGIPLEEFKGTQCEAITKVESYKDPNDLDNDGNPKIKTRPKIVRYLFEVAEEAAV